MNILNRVFGGGERGIQWRATIGHGPHAIARAIAEAVNQLG
jgi:hypothetical protein